MSDKRPVRASLCLLGCLLIWGDTPLLYAIMTTPGLELIAHRLIWSLVMVYFFFIFYSWAASMA
jgi:EamA domain-containing membrane protein RarD